jgi:hypothetical protein
MWGGPQYPVRCRVLKKMEDQARNKYLSFRIGNRPVISYIKMNVMENDLVTAVGTDVPETQIEALRNEVTKVEYVPPELPVSFPIFGIIFGILLIPFFLIGLGFLFFSWIGYSNGKVALKRAKEIKQLLNSPTTKK